MVAFDLFGEPWVLFRDEYGRPACIRDECAHRACPISLGKVVNGQAECPYHGVCGCVGGWVGGACGVCGSGIGGQNVMEEGEVVRARRGITPCFVGGERGGSLILLLARSRYGTGPLLSHAPLLTS